MNTLDKENEEKRVIPPALQKLLYLDVQATKKFLDLALQTTAFRSLRNHGKMLEWSCHGIIWLAGWMAFIWIANNPSLYDLQVNMLLALLLDIVVIAVTKALVRRRRPPATVKQSALGPDKYSFPSGHASRAFLVAFIFIYIRPVSFLVIPPLLAWVTSVCLTRILMERHYILDILGGLGIGLFEGLFMYLVWLSPATSASFLSFLSDEKLDGGEFHV